MSPRSVAFRLKAEATRTKWGAFRLEAEATRTKWGVALLLCAAALFAPACHRAIAPATTASLEDFHYSDPKTIAATGRPQLIEFVGPT
jgi:hypothetical protein